MKILFIGDKSNSSKLATKIIQSNFLENLIILYNHGNKYPSQISNWKGDWIISYKSDLILNEKILKKAKKGAINIHPAPPKYRGIGGYYYAIKNKDKNYGVTSHFMDIKIDHGKIIIVRTFPINDISKSSLLKKVTAQYCIGVLNELISYLKRNKPFPISKKTWNKKLYTRKELDKKINKK